MRRVRIAQDERGELCAFDAATGELIDGVYRIEIVRVVNERPHVTLCLDLRRVDMQFETTADLHAYPIPRPASMYGRT